MRVMRNEFVLDVCRRLDDGGVLRHLERPSVDLNELHDRKEA